MRRFVFSVGLALLGLGGCDATSSTIPVFGDPYSVERTPAPVLEGDSLRLTVTFRSGCNPSQFNVMQSLRGTEVWLRHRANDESCETYLTRELYLPVDTARLAPPPLRIYINPAETMELKIDSTALSD